MVGAHPDDEDTSLLATLARSRGVEAAYLSLTRGEGGQNRIGPESGEALGILRTGELLASRGRDGARQFFSRAYDFGYSRDTTDTFAHWPRDSVLADVVRAIRRFRPQIVVSIFGGTADDGHGHHQAAGVLAREAFEAAADAARFPGPPGTGASAWTVDKLYVHGRRSREGASLEVETGALDPLLGRSPHQLAMEARNSHRSQSFGTVESPGARVSPLHLVANRTGAEPDAPFFAGVDTSLSVPAGDLSEARARRVGEALDAYRRHLRRASEELRPADPAASLPALLTAALALEEAREGLSAGGPGDAGFLLHAVERRRRLLDRAILAAASVRLEARASDDVLVPGQIFFVRARVWNGSGSPVRLEGVELEASPGWGLRRTEGTRYPEGRTGPFGGTASLPVEVPVRPGPEGGSLLPAGALHRTTFEVWVPDEAASGLRDLSDPYYLQAARDGSLYRWPSDPALRGLPFRPPPLRAAARLRFAAPSGRDVVVRGRTAVRPRTLDRVSGERWLPLRVSPVLSVEVHPALALLPVGSPGAVEVEVRLRSAAPTPVRGSVALEAPEGWEVSAAAGTSFALEGEEEAAAFRFTARVPRDAREGSYALRPVAETADGRRLSRSVHRVEHPHVAPRLRTRPATVEVRRLALEVPALRVGWVQGPRDVGATALRRLGLEAHELGPGDWRPERLDELDAILVGVRAYEVRPDLVEANDLLLDWVRRGGTLVVQYNRYDLMGRHFAPYPLAVDRPGVERVTREDAPIRLLAPESPILARPNRIGAADFRGWIQERATFVPGSWDPRYRSLLEMSDPGEPPTRGSLLVARVGEGTYLHVTLSLFRQLEAGVPGAYRILANLLAADAGDAP